MLTTHLTQDVIISIVPEGSHVRAIFSSLPGGLASKLFLECSTIDIATSTSIRHTLESHSAVFVDAPVSGGPVGAANANLTIMAGIVSSHPRAEEITSILGKMGNVVRCGEAMGLVTKLCNNYVSGTIALATSEGYNLAMRLGLDPRVFNEVLKTSSAGSWVNDHVNVSGEVHSHTSPFPVSTPPRLPAMDTNPASRFNS